MNCKLYVKLKDGVVQKTTPIFSNKEELLVHFDSKWNVLGLTVSNYINYEVIESEQKELCQTIEK